MKYLYTALAVSGLCLSASVPAATVLESKNPMGQTQKMMLDGKRARMEGGAPGSYMLMLLDKEKMYAVNEGQKQIMDMSKPAEPPTGPPGMPEMQGMPGMPGMPKQGEARKVDAKLVKKGAGPEIAGYPTTHYQVTANGNVCSNEYISAKVLELPDVKNFVEASQKMKSQEKKGPIPFMRMDPCMQASMELADEMEGLGMSMRSVGKDGKARHEVASIKTGVDVPAGTFDLPEGYNMTTPQEMMQKAMQQMQERMKNMTPEQRKQMEQMHQRMMPPGGQQ